VRKGKSQKEKAARRGAAAHSVEAAPAKLPTGSPDGSTKPPGQRLYDMPYSATAPKLINPGIGLHNLVARAGHNAAYEIDVTLLDAADYRLTRSGVLLAHRVLDGRGEWFLTAPEWQPLLPKDRVETMGHTDLPQEFGELIRPLRRRATLGPVAALRCERREFALRDDQGQTLALLRDDKVTVRRGGLTTARYREVMITPIGPGLTEQQHAWLDRAITQAGATPVTRFPRLVSRLGAPATGLTDFPHPRSFERDAPFATFVSQLLGLRLREIVEADLAIRSGSPEAAEQLAGHAAQLRTELRGLSFVLDPDWVEDLYDELDWIILDADPHHANDSAKAAQAREQLVGRLHTERYLALLDRLVTATRAPKLGDASALATGQVLTDLLDSVVTRFRRGVDRLSPDAPTQAWEDAWRSIGQLQWVADISTHVMPTETERIQHRLAKSRRLLDQIHEYHTAADRAVEAAAGLPAFEAFAAGREFERGVQEIRGLKEEFLALWTKTKRKLDA
jgi:hypothetical protein